MTMAIDGAWLTDLIRTRFHEEGGTIGEARELLRATGVPTDALDEVTQGILEGRTCLRTLPDGRMSVEDDDADLPSMMQVAERTRKRLDLERLEAEMEADPLKFCDPWSTDVWHGYLEDMLRKRKNPSRTGETCWDERELTDMSPTEYLRVLLMESVAYDETTMGGTWTLEEPELMLECGFLGATSPSDRDRAWQRLFEATSDRPELRERNIRYLTDMAERAGQAVAIDRYDLRRSRMVDVPRPVTPRRLEMPESPVPTPQEPTQWSGLIAPDGGFYEARFAMHETLASRLAESLQIPQRTHESAIEALVRAGWAVCRTQPYQPYDRTPMLPNVLTRAQRDVLERTERLEDFRR